MSAALQTMTWRCCWPTASEIYRSDTSALPPALPLAWRLPAGQSVVRRLAVPAWTHPAGCVQAGGVTGSADDRERGGPGMRQPASAVHAIPGRGRSWLSAVLAAAMLAALVVISPAAGVGRDHGSAPAGPQQRVAVLDHVAVVASGGLRCAPDRGWLDCAGPHARMAAGASGHAVLASGPSWQLRGAAVAPAASRPGRHGGAATPGGVGSRAPPHPPVDPWS